MKHTLERLNDDTIQMGVTIPWIDVQKIYEEVVKDIVANSEMPGFRKGKAPRKLVEEKLDKTKAYEEVLKKLLPEVYNEIITEEKIKPIISPKIELEKAEEGHDWVLKIFTCERPNIKFKDYKKAITDMKATKQKKIWVPGTDKKPPEEEAKETKPTLDEILKVFYENTEVTVPRLLLENQVNRMLSDLIDQTRKLGLTVEQYLGSTGKTADSVRAEYEEQARRTVTLEFALEDLADKEGIIISDDDIDAVVKTAKTDAEKKALEQERYYIASVLRRQKTLDFLSSL